MSPYIDTVPVESSAEVEHLTPGMNLFIKHVVDRWEQDFKSSLAALPNKAEK